MGPIAEFFLGKQRGSVRVNEAVRRAEEGIGAPEVYQRPAPGAAPAQLTPEQQADWQQVGLGQMKLGEFRAKHGFLPNQPNAQRGMFSPPGR